MRQAAASKNSPSFLAAPVPPKNLNSQSHHRLRREFARIRHRDNACVGHSNCARDPPLERGDDPANGPLDRKEWFRWAFDTRFSKCYRTTRPSALKTVNSQVLGPTAGASRLPMTLSAPKEPLSRNPQLSFVVCPRSRHGRRQTGYRDNDSTLRSQVGQGGQPTEPYLNVTPSVQEPTPRPSTGPGLRI